MSRPALPAAFLDAAGLNRHYVFDLATLPDELLAPLTIVPGERQLILLGHAGRRLWECVQAAGIGGANPIDDYTVATVDRFFAGHCAACRYRTVYPGSVAIGLQSLGSLAGWHHASPFMVGVDAVWGSWHAYRAAIVADSDFLPGGSAGGANPCIDCAARPCLAACPAGAAGEPFQLAACGAERLRPGSPCARSCLSRLACPVGSVHRYDDAQLSHSYGQSLAMLETWRRQR